MGIFAWFRLNAIALASIAASAKSIAISLATLAAAQGGLSQSDRDAITTATAGLHASHERLQDALNAIKKENLDVHSKQSDH